MIYKEVVLKIFRIRKFFVIANVFVFSLGEYDM